MTSLKKLTPKAAYMKKRRKTRDITLPIYGNICKIVSKINLIFCDVLIKRAIRIILTLLITVDAVAKPPPTSKRLRRRPMFEEVTTNISKQFQLLLK